MSVAQTTQYWTAQLLTNTDRMWKQTVMSAQNLSQDIWSARLTPGPSKYEAGVVTTPLQHSTFLLNVTQTMPNTTVL